MKSQLRLFRATSELPAIVMDSDYKINPAGFTIHSAVHAAREDALCVMHLHTDYGIAVSAQQDGLLPISQQSLFVLASFGYHDYEGSGRCAGWRWPAGVARAAEEAGSNGSQLSEVSATD